MANDLQIGFEQDGYRYIGGDPADQRSWESTKIKSGTVNDGYRYLGGDPSNQSNWEDVREPGLIERIKEGARNTASFLKASATDDPEELAKIVAERQRTQLPVTEAGAKIAGDIRRSADQMQSADADIQRASAEGDLLSATRGVINSTGAGMLATGAKSLLSNPKETLGMIAENLPNSAPGLAGGLAGAAVGAATPVPGGAVIGGVVGGTAGGYNVELGGALYDQILKEAKDRGIDPADEKALAPIIAEKKSEFVEKARLKGIGTAGTDAVLNALTFGAAGAAERTLVRSANQIGKRVADGTIDAATGAVELAAIEAKNAARNTLGSKLARGTAVTGSEMAGEAASEYAGQKLAYGEADPTDVLLEGLLGAGQGVAMASGRGLANKAGEAVGLDNYTDVDKALAQNSALVEASRQREAGLGDIMGATDVGSAVDAAVKAADLDLKTSLVPELASDIDAYNAATLRAPALSPSDALELAAAKGAMDRVGSLDLSRPAAINAPASEITAAGDMAAREAEAAGGVATPAQAAILDRAFPGQKMYDQVVGSSEQVPTVDNQSAIITGTGRAPRETVRFDNPLEAENAEGWKRFAANQKQAAQTVANEATSVANQAPQVNVNNVISALQTTPGLQTAEQRVTLNTARQNLLPEDFQLLETAAVNRGNLSAEQQIRLRFMEKQGVSPQNQETPVSQENQATLSAQRTDEQETRLPQAELVYSPTKMGDGYRLVGTQNVNGREMFVYADESVTPTTAPNNTQLNQPSVPEMGTNVPNMGTTEPVTQTFTPKQGVATLESTATGNDEVGSTGTVNSDGKAYQYTVVESGVAPGVSGAIRQLARLFGKNVVFFNSDLAADGFVQPGKGSAIYINANSKMSPMAVFGHELMHLLKRDNPIAYKAVAAVVGRNLKADAASNFRDYYNAAGPNHNNELTDVEMEEVVADLMGNEFTQESFLSDVFNEIGQIAPEGQSRSIILRLAATINKAVKAALNVIKGMPVSQAFQTEQMVNNLEQIRASLKSALKEYAIQQKESAAKMAMEFTREESAIDLTQATLSPRRVPLSTRSIMDQEPGKARTSLGLVENPGRSDNKVREVAQKLNDRTVKNFGVISDTDTSEEAKMKLAKAMADEVAYQLGTTSETGTGLGWYSSNYPNAVKKLARVFPELGYSKAARDLFTAIVAVTSNGEKVSINISNAIKFYKQFRETGRLVGSGVGARRAGALDANIEVLESLIETHSLEGMSSFLMKEMTVGDMNAELRKLGQKTDSSYTADTVVPRAALYFGPKLGAFYANLMGAEGYLTMDLWWSRTFNRMRGVLIPSATDSSIKTLGELIGKPNASREEIVQASVEPRNAYEDRNYKTELEIVTGEKEPNNKAGKELWMAKAKKAAGPRFDELLQQQRIEKTANTIYKNEYEGLAEAPFRASDRKFMFETTLVVQKLLKRKFGKLSIADIQAALWYYEKRLYATLSGGQANDIGYEEAILEHAKSDRPERPSAYFNRGSDEGNDRQGEGGISEQVLRSGGQADGREAQLSKTRVNFEVAPDPNDASLSGAWNSVSVQQRYDISKSVAENLIPRALRALGATGTMTSQVGSYLDDTNVSFALQLDQADKADQVQKFLGFMLSQDSMMTVSQEDFPGSERVGAVTISIGDADPAKIYAELRKIEVDGEQVVGGQSTANGQMVVLNYSPVSVEKLADLINQKLDDKYNIDIDEVFASFPSKEDYGYASERSQGSAAAGGSPLQRDANYLRSEASKLVREKLRDAGAKFSPARSDAASSGRSGSVSQERSGEVPSYGVSTEGSIQVRGVHYSRAERDVLDGKFYGQGVPGSERRRVFASNDRRIRERIYFYVDTGKGIKPEAGVGSNPHAVDLNNIYDAVKDKSIQRSVSTDLRGDDWMNAFESAVIDAGYDGYVAPFGNMQAAVLIGNHTVDLARPPKTQDAKLSNQRYNALGNPIYPTENGQQNFWKWIEGIRRGGVASTGVSGEGRGGAESASARAAGLGERFFFDDAGRPKVLFHGTAAAINEFDLNHPDKKDFGWLGKGVYLTSDVDMAEGYANLKGSMRDQAIMPVYAYLRNPYMFTADEKYALSKQSKESIEKFTQRAQEQGYDGGVLEFDDGTYEVVLFNNNQVKSASGNDGSFDLNSAQLSTSRQTVADAIAGYQFKQELVNQAKYKLADIIAPGNGFNWFHKTVGTQFHKAKVNPLFKKVFDLGQQFLDDVTLFATRAEDKAADIFPRFGLSKSLLKTGLSKSDNQLVARALTDGTLENGADPHTGVVWSDEELRSKYGMNDNQIGYYRQARAALDQSLDDLAKSEMATHMRIAMKANITPLIRADISLADVRDMLIQSLDAGIASTTNEEAVKMLQKTKSQINGIYSTTTNLKNHGYAPLMRFGNYTVTAYDENGDVAFFQMTDTKSEASLMAKNLEGEFDRIETGKMSAEAHKLFKGITPDTLELFAKHTALGNDALTQEYLQLAVSSRSAMKRLINRKGTTGYSLDATRTLATFLTSNARKSSSALNMYDMKQAADAIPREDGDVKDEAIKLVEYLQNPGEEAAKLRGFLFFQYLGGSIASGIVNLTQPILQTYPYLSQFGAGQAGSAMKTGTVAATHFLRGKRVGDPNLQAALEKAKAEGLIDPQEIYQLMAASQSGAGSFLSYKLMRLWGINFGVTEIMNRTLTFAAAFKVGQSLSKEELQKAGAKDAYSFAQGAIYETQGLYNKGNRPDWARGAVGGTIFTFKQYSISYLEFMTRLYKNDKKAFGIALAVLVMASGLQGLPGADDLDDVIDTGGNWLGYATNTKKWKREFLEDVFGKEMAAFALHGVSTIPGMPIDVQARLGLGNIIPGTGLMNPTKKDKGREVAEVFGVAGGLAMSTMDTTEALARGDVRRAALAILPGAVRNLIQASEMAATGEYRDTRGRLVQKVDGGDVIAKAIGFQPAEIAAGNRRMREVQADIDIVKAKQEEVNGKYARAIVDKDQDAMAEVRAEMQDWNKKNPDLRIKFNMSAIQQRVKQAKLTKEARFIKSAPQQIRQQVREAVLAD